MWPVGERGALSGGGNWLGLFLSLSLSKMALSVQSSRIWRAFWLFFFRTLAARGCHAHGAICSYST